MAQHLERFRHVGGAVLHVVLRGGRHRAGDFDPEVAPLADSLFGDDPHRHPVAQVLGYRSASGQGRFLGRAALVIETGSIHGGRSIDL